MDPLTISSVVAVGKSLIERIWPDPQKQSEELRKLQELEQQGDLARLNAHVQVLLGQLKVNEKEAEHKSIFVAGWRPAVGWVGASALAVAFIPKSVVITILWTMQAYTMLQGCQIDMDCDITKFELPDFPDLGLTDLFGILGGILGIGTMRSWEKSKGVATNAIGSKSQ